MFIYRIDTAVTGGFQIAAHLVDVQLLADLQHQNAQPEQPEPIEQPEPMPELPEQQPGGEMPAEPTDTLPEFVPTDTGPDLGPADPMNEGDDA